MPMFTSKNKIVIGVLVLLALIILCAQRLYLNCFWWECAPRRDFSVLDLNLPNYLFTSTATIERLRYIRNDLSADPAVSAIRWDGGNASYTIVKFSTNPQATVEYNFQISSHIFTTPLEASDNVSDILEATESSWRG
jgi:hypothetical protein